MKSLVRHVVFLAMIALAAILAGCSSDSSPPSSSTSTEAVLSAIVVEPKGATLTRGATVALTATGTYTDGATKDLTALVAWSSSDPEIALVSNAPGSHGLVTGVRPGSVTVTAAIELAGASVTGGTSIVVTDARLTALSVSPPSPTLAKGTQVALVATGTFDDGTTEDLTGVATWSSSNEALATVSDAGATRGLVTAIDAGTALVRAAVGDVSAVASVSITSAFLTELAVTAPDPWVVAGATVQLTAVGVFSDDSTQDLTAQATWASSDPSVAVSDAADSKGLATAIAEGAATISATALGVTGTRLVQVTAATLTAIEVTPKGAVLAAGTKAPFVATGILSDQTFLDLTAFVLWSSSDESVATVVGHAAGEHGIVTGVAAGTAEIRASFGGLTAAATVTVSAATLEQLDLVPLDPSVPKGLHQRFLAIGTFSDATAQDLTAAATWGSSDAAVVTVSNAPGQKGLATTLAEGVAVVTASLAARSAATTITVTEATLESITVTPTGPSIAKGTSLMLTATGTYSDETTRDLTKEVAWLGSSPIVSVSNATGWEGLVIGLAEGTATVTATLGGVSGSTGVTVTAASLLSIAVTPTNPAIAKGTYVPLTATGVYSDHTTQDLTALATWSSDDASVSVSNATLTHGLAIGLVVGSADVTATYGGTSGSTKVTVTAAVLEAIEVTPDAASLADGTSIHLAAKGHYSDGGHQDLTTTVAWSSSDAAIAYVSNAPYWQGTVFAAGQGTATITATHAGKTGAATITVTAATLVEVTLTPAGASMAKGTTQWFHAMAKWSDGSAQDVTEAATFSTSDATKLIVSNALGSKGLATAVAEGTVSLYATYGGRLGSTAVTVTAASLASILVLPANLVVVKETATPYQAIGLYSDDSSQTITSAVTWSSSDVGVAITSNAYGSKGLVTSVAPGTTTITATHPASGITGSTKLTVVTK